jgi:hypothetical protein
MNGIIAEDVATQGATGTALIVITAIGGLVSIVGSILAYLGHKHSREANMAVNNKKPGEDRLFDMVVETRQQVRDIGEWKMRWDDIDPKIGSADALEQHIAVIEDRIVTTGDATMRRIDRSDEENAVAHSNLSTRIDTVAATLTAHIEWEGTQKYPQPASD